MTVLNKIINELEQGCLIVKTFEPGPAVSAFEACIQIVKQHLPAEQQQIKDAWINGFNSSCNVSESYLTTLQSTKP